MRFLSLLVAGLALSNALGQEPFRLAPATSEEWPAESAIPAGFGSEFNDASDEVEVTATSTANSAAPDPKAAPLKPPKPPGPPPSPYKGVFYDNDFSYLNDPNNTTFGLGDMLKQNQVGPAGTLDLGGEFRLRQNNEHNFRGVVNTQFGFDDDFLLLRTRLYGNWQVTEWFRFYGETLDATSHYEKLAPRAIEENRWEALNLFGDLLLEENDDGKLWGRAWRQELLYGVERLISPLDWSNTRRTFDGAKLFWRGGDWNVDGFWVRPVPFGQHAFNDHNFDRADQSQEFIGLYATNKADKDNLHDFYYLRLAEYQSPATPANPVNFDEHTLGTRWWRKWDCWLAEFEGAYQFGEFGDKIHSAGFYTIGVGHEWSWRPLKPTLWAYYDWASGTRDPFGSVNGTFNQLFPLAHKYFGFMDLVGRQNIRDVNFVGTLSPSDKTKFLCWYHIFHLDQARDALYNAAGSPTRVDPTGAAGRYVGQEIDFTYLIVTGLRSDLLLGYSHFFQGTFIRDTNPPGISGNADFFYLQYTQRF